MATTNTLYPESSFLVNILNSFSHRTIITTDNEGSVNFISFNECQQLCNLPKIGDSIYNQSLFSNEMITPILNGLQKEEHSITKEHYNTLNELFHLKIIYSPILTEEQEIKGLLIVVKNITHEYLQSKKIEQQERQYQTLFESSSDAIIIHDLEGKILDLNKKSVEMFGIDKDEFLTLYTQDLAVLQNQDEKHQRLNKVLQEEGSANFECQLRRKNQTIFLSKISANLVELDGNTLIQAIITDVSSEQKALKALEQSNKQLKKSEKNLLEAQHIARVGNWEFNIANQKVTWSDEIYKIFELEDVKINYESFLEYIHPNDRKKVIQAYKDSLEKDIPYHLTYRIITVKGTLKYVEDQCRNIRDENNKLVRSLGTLQDTTEHTLVEIELLKSQKNYQSILDNMQDTYYRTNLKGELIHLSKGVEALSGYKMEELMGKNLADFYYDPSVRDTFLKDIALHHGTYSFQAQLVHRTKKIVWMYSNSRYWHDDNGNIGGVEGFARDITQEKLALDALSQSEERWLLALEGAKHGVWDWKIQEEKVYFSRQWSAMLGYEEDEIENTFKAWLALIHPDDLFRVLNAIRNYIGGSKDKYQIQFRMLCQDGDYKWVQSQGAIWERDEQGEALRMVGTHSDITELQQAHAKEKRLIDLIESSSNEIYVFDKKSLCFNYVNQGGINNLQYSIEELYEKHPYDITSNFTEEQFRASIQPLIDNSITELRLECIHQREDGSTYPIQMHLQLLDTQVSTEFLAVVIDISEQKEMNKKIKEQEEMMLVQSRHAAMGEMISMIAHQWRQPISVVGMLANSMKHMLHVGKIDDTHGMQEDLKTISDQVQYMSKTIDDFRNFFQKSNSMEEVNLYSLLIEANSILEAVLQRHGIKLTIDCPKDITLTTYSRELVQLFINIISNARDALEKFSGKKNILVHVVEKNEEVHISIFNNGFPIEESIKTKIFEPYFTTKGNLGGTGLGLYMVKSILDKHMHGKISVENREDGVSFNITIPKKQIL